MATYQQNRPIQQFAAPADLELLTEEAELEVQIAQQSEQRAQGQRRSRARDERREEGRYSERRDGRGRRHEAARGRREQRGTRVWLQLADEA